MEHFEKAMLDVQKMLIRDSNGKMNQTDRNKARNMLVDALAIDLGGVRTPDGIGLEIPHDEWGAFNIEIKVVAKGNEFDVVEANETFKSKVEKQAARKAEAERKAAERQAKIAAAKAKTE